MSQPQFASGDFEGAFKASFASIHEALLVCKSYKPEMGAFCSGTTVSAVLVTGEALCCNPSGMHNHPTPPSGSMTYFAFLGDSPFVILKRDSALPFFGFDLHDRRNKKDCQRIEAASSLLMFQSKREQQVLFYFCFWSPFFLLLKNLWNCGHR